MTSIVYMETDYSIKNIVTHAQYLLNFTGDDDYILVTLIGEYHGVSSDTNKVSKDIDEYIVEQGKMCKTKLILELDSESSADTTISTNIKKIVNTMKTSHVPNIIPIYNDYRYAYLDRAFYSKLYHHIDEVSTYDYTTMIDMYVKPFYEKTDSLKDISSEIKLYSPLVYKFYEIYLHDLDISFRKIIEKLKDWNSMSVGNLRMISTRTGKEILVNIRRVEIIENLQKQWAKVSDFFLLRELFKLGGTKQFIILVGQEHFLNIIGYFDSIFLKMNFIKKIASKNLLFETCIV